MFADESIYAAPVADGDDLFFGDGPRGGSVEGGRYAVYRVERSTGKILWRTYQYCAWSTSPAVCGDWVVIAGDGVYAFSRNDGKELWAFKNGSGFLSSPAVSGNSVVIGSQDRHVYSLELKTGKERWRFKTEGFVLEPVAVSEGSVFVCGDDGHTYAISEGKGALLWKSVPARRSKGPAVSGGSVFIADEAGCLRALDAKLGKVLWSFQGQSDSPNPEHLSLSPPIVAGQMVVVVSVGGIAYALEAASGALKWKSDQKSLVLGSPSYAAGTIYFVTEGPDVRGVTALDGDTGALKWRRPVSGISGSPIPSGDMLFVADRRRRLLYGLK